MNITFKQTNNHMHQIFINGKKAGLIELLSCSFDAVIKDTDLKDWRVFFWGKYSKFQVMSEVLGFAKRGGHSVSLNEIKEILKNLVNTNPELLLPAKNYEEKGYVLCHASNGDILTINTEYDYRFSEYFSLKSHDVLFTNKNNLIEVTEKLIEKEKGKNWWYGDIVNVEYKMLPEIFDTSYME